MQRTTTAPVCATPYEGFDKQMIDGAWRAGQSEKVQKDQDPYTGETLLEIRSASREDVDAAYLAAERAQRAWGASLPEERADVLRRAVAIIDARAEEIVAWIVRESGSTRIKAGIELASARGIMLASASYPARVEGRIFASGIKDQESRAYREPLGVVGVISPWNFPFHLSMRSVAPALALGNGVVIKPASDTPITGGLLLGKIFEEAGLPPGVLNVVVGAGSEIGDFFVEHRVPRLISFTGSTTVGRNIGRLASGGKYIKRVALELGGNAPLVVLADADVDQAAHAAVVGRFLHQGQICMSTNRVIVDAKIHHAFVDAVTARVEALPVGNPDEAGTVIGPIVNDHQLADLLARIARAKRDGAHQVAGGAPQGKVLPPHVFTEVDPAWSIAREESFGPLLPILRARDEAHALELANDTEFGLSSAVFTRDLERGVRFARGIVAGMTHINDISVDDQPNAPFGGEKNSGLGRFNGEWAIEEFTRLHWITLQYAPRDYPF
ncbi:aldehyde dehydrogenase family protein [Robbsia sp. Bb-Pol-6]|uniref:Aldehyde dehydrogenase family protein n=1 Tax=Robbsia betulipollinis TaxID=2981849 RepID=A0ABT3ZLF8_9BURK|nr:aldehyde dehydrogenase family protein [Robbsia betulipollinis]MCY0386778.1 aldehyde dehydrogenase family protein [Robbsia betulipollinis]